MFCSLYFSLLCIPSRWSGLLVEISFLRCFSRVRKQSLVACAWCSWGQGFEGCKRRQKRFDPGLGRGKISAGPRGLGSGCCSVSTRQGGDKSSMRAADQCSWEGWTPGPGALTLPRIPLLQAARPLALRNHGPRPGNISAVISQNQRPMALPRGASQEEPTLAYPWVEGGDVYRD